MLNPQKGNMYSFITHTLNIIKGKCPHACSYCYMHQDRLKPLRLDEKEFKTDLSEGSFIFVGSSTDMWADDVPEEWIRRVLEFCRGEDTSYLFQSKNPKRINDFLATLSGMRVTIGTTIETNRAYPQMGLAPSTGLRASAMSLLQTRLPEVAIFPLMMVTIEPIMDFDLAPLVDLIRMIEPNWVNIGADSKGHNLPEPPPEKIKALIAELKTFTGVRQKKNLKRLLK